MRKHAGRAPGPRVNKVKTTRSEATCRLVIIKERKAVQNLKAEDREEQSVDKNSYSVLRPLRPLTPARAGQNNKSMKLIAFRCGQWFVHIQFQKESVVNAAKKVNDAAEARSVPRRHIDPSDCPEFESMTARPQLFYS